MNIFNSVETITYYSFCSATHSQDSGALCTLIFNSVFYTERVGFEGSIPGSVRGCFNLGTFWDSLVGSPFLLIINFIDVLTIYHSRSSFSPSTFRETSRSELLSTYSGVLLLMGFGVLFVYDYQLAHFSLTYNFLFMTYSINNLLAHCLSTISTALAPVFGERIIFTFAHGHKWSLVSAGRLNTYFIQYPPIRFRLYVDTISNHNNVVTVLPILVLICLS